MYCPHCGKEIETPSSFCPHCGKPIMAEGLKGSTSPSPPIPESIAAGSIPQKQEKKEWIKGVNNNYVIVGGIIVLLLLGIMLNIPRIPGTNTNTQTSQPKPAQLNVISMSTKQTTQIPTSTGYSVTIDITLGNTGDVTGSFSVSLRDNGINYKSDTVSIPAHSQQTLSWTYSSAITGDHKLSINDQTSMLTIQCLPTYTARQIYSDYDSNEIAAEQKYKGKVFFVTGTIDSIGKDIMNTPYVTLDVGELLSSVQCLFDKSLESKLATFNEGDRVIIRATGWSYLFNVMLKPCDLIQKE